MTIDESTLAGWARDAGFAECALCDANDFDSERLVVAGQPPLAERRQLRFCPGEDWPQIQSLAVLLWPYAEHEDEPPAGQVFVDGYYEASNAAYHAAAALEERLTHAGCFARANVSYPARRAAVRAGLGLIGNNGLLITHNYGTRVVIILLATDIPVVRERVKAWRTSCLNCGRCTQACPAGALGAEGMTHPERCMRNFMMEGIVVPEALRPRMGMRLIGCDVCQRVCPMQRPLEEATHQGFALGEFVTADEAAFSAGVARLARQIGRNVARPQRVRAQAALLAGNSGNTAFLPVLRVWAQSDFEAVRTHARWAIGQLAQEEDAGLDPD